MYYDLFSGVGWNVTCPWKEGTSTLTCPSLPYLTMASSTANPLLTSMAVKLKWLWTTPRGRMSSGWGLYSILLFQRQLGWNYFHKVRTEFNCKRYLSSLANGAEYLFQAADPNELGLWIEKINGPSSASITLPPPEYSEAMKETST